MNSLINRALQRALGKTENDSQIDLEVKFELPGNYEESLKIVADSVDRMTQEFGSEVTPPTT